MRGLKFSCVYALSQYLKTYFCFIHNQLVKKLDKNLSAKLEKLSQLSHLQVLIFTTSRLQIYILKFFYLIKLCLELDLNFVQHFKLEHQSLEHVLSHLTYETLDIFFLVKLSSSKPLEDLTYTTHRITSFPFLMMTENLFGRSWNRKDIDKRIEFVNSPLQIKRAYSTPR